MRWGQGRNKCSRLRSSNVSVHGHGYTNTIELEIKSTACHLYIFTTPYTWHNEHNVTRTVSEYHNNLFQ